MALKAREVHDFLNSLWGDIFKLNEELRGELSGRGFTVEEVEAVFGAYLFIDGKWEPMKYPHPAFEVRPQIEVGATPEAYYFVVAVPKDRVGENFLGLFLEIFPRSFIYGSEEFLTDLYNWRRDGRLPPTEVLDRILGSREAVLQFEANFGSAEMLRRGLLRLITLGNRFGIFEM